MLTKQNFYNRCYGEDWAQQREGKTNLEGMYEIDVDEDHMDEVCDGKSLQSMEGTMDYCFQLLSLLQG